MAGGQLDFTGPRRKELSIWEQEAVVQGMWPL